MITNTMLSLMLPGEEYTVIKNELDSTILGKQEVQDLDHLQVNNEDAGFEFPHLGNETLESMFGRTSEVGIQVNSFWIQTYSIQLYQKQNVYVGTFGSMQCDPQLWMIMTEQTLQLWPLKRRWLDVTT